MHIYLRLSENPHIYYFQKGMGKFGIGKMTLMKKIYGIPLLKSFTKKTKVIGQIQFPC